MDAKNLRDHRGSVFSIWPAEPHNSPGGISGCRHVTLIGILDQRRDRGNMDYTPLPTYCWISRATDTAPPAVLVLRTVCGAPYAHVEPLRPGDETTWFQRGLATMRDRSLLRELAGGYSGEIPIHDRHED